MSVARTTLLLSAALLSAPSWGQPRSDARRLYEGLSPQFQRPSVQIYPLLDQRLLSLDPGDAPPPPPPAWGHLIEALVATANLQVQAPEQTIARLRREGRRGLEVALGTLKAAYQDHRQVRLEAAIRGFEAAVAGLSEWSYEAIAPQEMAKALITSGLASLESQREGEATRAFERALLTDPSARLRAGYDHPSAVAAFEATRARLLTHPPRPAAFNQAGKGRQYRLRARALADRLEIAIQGPSGIRFEIQPLTEDPREDASRLASRVRACLPFGHAPAARRHRERLYLDGGFSTLGFIERPVGRFYSVGVGAGLMWNIAPNVGLAASASLTNSNRDEAEDLRGDIPALLLFFGPGIYDRDGRLRLSAQLGGEVAVLGEVKTTTNAACKYFSPEDDIPKTLCDFETDIDQTPMGISVGPALQLEAALRVVDEIYLSGRISSAAFVFESQTNGLDYPVQLYVGLGYRLF